MAPVRTFLFDLGNVILHFSHERMWRQVADLCGRSVPDVQALMERDDLANEFERGRLSEADFYDRLRELTASRFGLAAFRAALADIFELNTPMPDLLERLRGEGYRLVLLSNTNETHLAWVRERFSVLDYFDELVVSFQVGVMKPEPGMYEAALNAIECRPEECFYTDDIMANIQAGREFGLQAELFTDAPSLIAQLEQRGVRL
jgi:putative hydrolase of the HAD superfamily